MSKHLDKNEAFYRALFDMANDGIMLIQGTRLVDCNQRLLEILGRSRESVVGSTPWDISPPKQADGVDTRLKAREYLERGRRGEKQMFHWLHTRGDGSIIDTEVSLSLLPRLEGPCFLGHLRDITERIKIQRALKDSEEKYRHIVEDQTEFIVRWKPDGTRTFVNGSYARYFDTPKEDLIGTSFFPLIVPEDRERIWAKVKTITPSNPVAVAEHLVIAPNGELRWQRWSDRGIFDADGNIVEYQSVGQDVHDRRVAEELLRVSEEKFSKAFRWSPEIIMITKIKDGTIIEVNEGFEENTGYLSSEVIGRTTSDIHFWSDLTQHKNIMQLLSKKNSFRDLDIDVRIKTGEIRNCLTSADTIDIDGEPCLVSVTRDVTESRKTIAALEYQATHDSLTDLPNRNWLRSRLEKLIGQYQEVDGVIALMLMDLNRFKEINDTFGHHTGDNLLKQVGPRITDILQPACGSIARLGGDEFAIILENCEDLAAAAKITKRILNTFQIPYSLNDLQLEIGASIGLALFPEHGQDVGTLLRRADIAMYIAKEDASGYAFYHPDRDSHSPKRLVLMSELRTAIETNQLRLNYQPKIDIASGQTLGFEALVRWQHPLHGWIPPAQFIPFAEMGESIRPLTYWVMEQAIRQCQLWNEQGYPNVMSVNLSTRNLLDEGCTDRLARLLKKYHLDPGSIELEITESAFIKDPNRALDNLEKIHSTGVQLSIDDFGTGYSSMSYLKRMPLHNLKIDMSFIQHMQKSKQDEVIVKSTVNLAHNLGLSVIAEGVEDQPTLDALREIGCDFAQGYFFAKPLSLSEAEAWLRHRGQSAFEV